MGAKIAAAGLTLSFFLGNQSYAEPTWQMVVPVLQSHHRIHVGQVFANQLQHQVRVNTSLTNQGSKALEAALAQTSRPHSLVLMTEELLLVGDAAKKQAQHFSHYVPLLVIMETRWCLFTGTDSPVSDASQLKNWMRNKATAPRIAIPVSSGRMRLWVQAMAQRTQRAWQMDTYGIGGNFSLLLQQGVDLALGRCDQQWGQAHRMRILAKGAVQEDGFLADVPSLTELGLLPYDNGWLAWMAPAHVPQVERAAMAQQLYKISRQPNVQAYLAGAEQPLIDFSPEASLHYVHKFAQTWNQIGHLLLDQDFGNFEKLQGLAKPRY